MASAFITTIQIILFIVFIRLIWLRLDGFSKSQKVIMCIAGVVISFVVTSILFSISTNGIDYENIEIKHKISKTLNMVFTPINGMIFIPFIANLFSKIRLKEISQQEVTKKALILGVIFLVICFIEVKYLKHIQLGMFDIYKLKG